VLRVLVLRRLTPLVLQVLRVLGVRPLLRVHQMLGVLLVLAAPIGAQQVFKSGVDGVTVVVSVRRGNQPVAGLTSAAITKQYAELAQKPGVAARKDGDFDAAFAKGAKTIERVFEAPYLAHACMEPMNCTAKWTADKCEVWVATQNGDASLAAAAEAAPLPLLLRLLRPQRRSPSAALFRDWTPSASCCRTTPVRSSRFPPAGRSLSRHSFRAAPPIRSRSRRSRTSGPCKSAR